MAKLERESYENQLMKLDELLMLGRLKLPPAELTPLMILSLAESVKAARDHNLNCSKEHGPLAAKPLDTPDYLTKPVVVVNDPRIPQMREEIKTLLKDDDKDK